MDTTISNASTNDSPNGTTTSATQPRVYPPEHPLKVGEAELWVDWFGAILHRTSTDPKSREEELKHRERLQRLKAMTPDQERRFELALETVEIEAALDHAAEVKEDLVELVRELKAVDEDGMQVLN